MYEQRELNRNVWCILGLPFDAVGMNSAITKVTQSIKNKQECFLSTPNLNFVVACEKDKNFRDSIINSDLSIVDGMPLVWVAKFLGFPLTERVSGSGLIEELNLKNKTKESIKVFFFGGVEGAAKHACEKLNKGGQQLTCVGYYYPGFGTIDEMSRESIINQINESEADFVIVSLGAKKGQAWIMKNREKIDSPVISHLGAVVNFISGEINRAPTWMQKTGLEWLWRILQEPKLWKRYLSDGITLLRFIITKVIPYKIVLLFLSKNNSDNSCAIKIIERDNEIELNASGDLIFENIQYVRASFLSAINYNKNIILNLNMVTNLDSSIIGLILVLIKLAHKKELRLKLSSTPKRIKRIINLNGAGYILT